MLIVSLLLCTMAAATLAGAMAKRASGDRWRPFHFDGREFKAGTGTGTVVQLRDGYLPLIRQGQEAVPEQELQGQNGAVAGLCYIQAAGGKLQDAGGVRPLAGLPLHISGDRVRTIVTTDSRGFFLVQLPPGEYDLRAGGIVHRVRVQQGKSSLLALRGGKTMVD